MSEVTQNDHQAKPDPFVDWMERNRRWFNPLFAVLVIFVFRNWLGLVALSLLMVLNSVYFYRKGLKFETRLFAGLALACLAWLIYLLI